MSEVPRIGHASGGDDVAPDLAEFDATAPDTTLQGLLGELEQVILDEVEFEPITLAVKKRPNVSVRYSTEIDNEKITRWRNLSKSKKGRRGADAELDNLRFCALVLATQCEAILMRGIEVEDEAGQRLTFGHKWIRDRMKADRAADAAIRMYGSDIHLQLDANAVLDAAGFGEEAVEVDEAEGPTE